MSMLRERGRKGGEKVDLSELKRKMRIKGRRTYIDAKGKMKMEGEKRSGGVSVNGDEERIRRKDDSKY